VSEGFGHVREPTGATRVTFPARSPRPTMTIIGVTFTLLAAFAILAMAAVAQAVTGFGFALLSVPLLALVVPIQDAVVAGSLASLALTIGISIRERAHVRWRTTGILLAVAVVGMPVGYWMLTTLPEPVLTLVVGVSVLVSTFLVWRRPTISAGPVSVGVVGLLVGVLTTSTGTNGPPLVAAFQSMGFPPRVFRATTAAVFTGCGLVACGLFAAGGQIGRTALLIWAVSVPAIVGGFLAGDRVFRRLDHGRFRTVVLWALIVASIITIGRAVKA
jgi:uncharacterized membrane protein YfcA